GWPFTARAMSRTPEIPRGGAMLISPVFFIVLSRRNAPKATFADHILTGISLQTPPSVRGNPEDTRLQSSLLQAPDVVSEVGRTSFIYGFQPFFSISEKKRS